MRSSVRAGIAEALGGKEAVASEIVHSVLTQRVNPSSGEIVAEGSYRYKEAVPLIDWYAQKVIREAAKEIVAEMVEARRGEIRKAIKRALVDDSTINAMASEYVSALVRECGRGYTPKFEVSFEKERGY